MTIYSPAVETYKALATITLSGQASSVTFSSIPTDGTYRDLVLITKTAVHNNADNNRNLLLRFNSDTTGSYTRVVMSGYPSTTGSVKASSETHANVDWQTTNNGDYSYHIIQIFDFAATDKHKVMLTRSNKGLSTAVEATANNWASGSAINTVLLYFDAYDFAAGSQFDLFGIAA